MASLHAVGGLAAEVSAAEVGLRAGANGLSAGSMTGAAVLGRRPEGPLRPAVRELMRAVERRCMERGFPSDPGGLLELLLGMQLMEYDPGPAFFKVGEGLNQRTLVCTHSLSCAH